MPTSLLAISFVLSHFHPPGRYFNSLGWRKIAIKTAAYYDMHRANYLEPFVTIVLYASWPVKEQQTKQKKNTKIQEDDEVKKKWLAVSLAIEIITITTRWRRWNVYLRVEVLFEHHVLHGVTWLFPPTNVCAHTNFEIVFAVLCVCLCKRAFFSFFFLFHFFIFFYSFHE